VLGMRRGVCECGCGQRTKLAARTQARYGLVRGQPQRFVYGHRPKSPRGSDSPMWKGGRYVASSGYVFVWQPEHPRADVNGYVYEHILVASRVLGKPLPAHADVHHVNEVKHENVPGNLVICEDRAYHLLLHTRLRALRACGHASWRRCFHCRQWDAPTRLRIRHRKGAFHLACEQAHRRQKRALEG
jgi:HNH endonuclease